MKQVTHPEYQDHYYNGHQTMKDKIKAMGPIACRDEFNMIHPPGQKENFYSLAAYYYAKGEFDAIDESLNK